MILSDFLRALGQIGDRRILRVMALGGALAIALLFGIYLVLIGVIGWFVPGSLTIPLIGPVEGVDTLFGWGSLVLVLVLSVFMMVPVAAAFTAFFLEEVADAVEDRNYPGLPEVRPLGIWDSLVEGVGLMGLLLAVSLLSLLLWPFAGPVMPFLAWGINGYLLGREYFTLVAARRLGRDGARAMRLRHSGQVWLAGVLMAAPLSFPLINLLVPVLGVATFTHLFHRLNGTRP
jgi:CysZ protein